MKNIGNPTAWAKGAKALKEKDATREKVYSHNKSKNMKKWHKQIVLARLYHGDTKTDVTEEITGAEMGERNKKLRTQFMNDLDTNEHVRMHRWVTEKWIKKPSSHT